MIDGAGDGPFFSEWWKDGQVWQIRHNPTFLSSS
jgi:hypothetical protein